MTEKETFYTSDRNTWRKWLSDNFETKTEIWLVFPSRDSGEAILPYNDAVEEALCFGWIDSTTGHIDAKHGIRRFTPRKDFSYFSRPNIERLIWLNERKLIHPQIQPLVENLINAEYVFPHDIIEKIKADESAWKNYQNFSEPYKRIRITYIDEARNCPEEFAKRLKNFISKTRENKIIVGFGGDKKYYK